MERRHVARLARLGKPVGEIAAWVGVDSRTLRRRFGRQLATAARLRKRAAQLRGRRP
jgi:hypothetical protein